jgi:hypothetical protein
VGFQGLQTPQCDRARWRSRVAHRQGRANGTFLRQEGSSVEVDVRAVDTILRQDGYVPQEVIGQVHG